MNERERNKRLILLLDKLIVEKDLEAIELIQSMVIKDTPAMIKSFEVITNLHKDFLKIYQNNETKI